VIIAVAQWTTAGAHHVGQWRSANLCGASEKKMHDRFVETLREPKRAFKARPPASYGDAIPEGDRLGELSIARLNALMWH
jgi:hypothetical protein